VSTVRLRLPGRERGSSFVGMARVQIYTTPICPYCVRAKRLLQSREIAYDEIDVSEDEALREEVIQRTSRRTVPQIFIDGRSIGGFEELAALDARAELVSLVEDGSDA
jgi:glutaredoxin 3